MQASLLYAELRLVVAGACYGFKLDGLLKFMETKGQDGTTLLNYLSGTIMKKSPELKDFDSELTR